MAERDDTMDADLRDAAKEYLVRYGGDVSSDSGTRRRQDRGGAYELRPFFINPCLPILQPDPMRGGMTDLRKIATLADTWGITIAPHLFPELNVHLLASIPNGIWCENMGLLDDLWVDPLMIQNGMITAPERPGHGLRFRDEVRREFTS
jgi:L-alanine-DL-glutamate epimerase-like enolase superfamily enzyme